MARFVHVAAVEFHTRAEPGAAHASAVVLAELDGIFGRLRGYGLDLVVFSEGVAATGQTVETAEEVSRPGPFLAKHAEFAASEHCHVAASVKTTRNARVYNSIVFLGPEGEILGVYDKSNLTQGEIEEGLTPGAGAVVVDTVIGRLGGIVCFDLNFEWLRFEYREKRPDILCFASLYHGGLMQEVWAYECRSFFVSALPFHGAGIRDPFGRALATTDCYTSIARTRINLDRAMVHLDYNREKFPDIERKYLGEVAIDIPPNLDPAPIYSLTDQRSALDVVEEFGLELLDHYLERSLALNARRRAETAGAGRQNGPDPSPVRERNSS